LVVMITVRVLIGRRWVGGLFGQGYQKGLEDIDIYDVLPEDSSIKLSSRLGK